MSVPESSAPSFDEAIRRLVGAQSVVLATPARVEIGDDTPIWGHLLVACGWGYLAGLGCGVVSRLLARAPGGLGAAMTRFTDQGGNAPEVIWVVAQVVAVAYLLAVLYRALARATDVVVLTDDRVYVVTGVRVAPGSGELRHDAVHELARSDLRTSRTPTGMFTGSFRMASDDGEVFVTVRSYRLRRPAITLEGGPLSTRELARLLLPRR